MNYKEPSCQRTEEDLRECESKYRDLADSLPQTVAEIDLAGNITFTNLASFVMFGYSRDDFDEGLNIFQHIAPEDLERARENIQKLITGQKLDGEEYTGIKKDGSRFPFIVYSTPVLRENKMVGFRVILIDITERKRSEKALRDSQIQLSEAMDLAHIVYWEFDHATKTYVFNDPFYALYGTTAEEEGGYRMTIADYAHRFVHPDDQVLFYNLIKQKDEKTDLERRPVVEHRIIRRDGETRHILVRKRTVKDDSGSSPRVYGTNQDITERKRAEELLHKSEEKFRKAFYTSPDSININRLTDGLYVSVNRGFSETMGYSEDDIKGKTSVELNIWDNTDDRARLVKGLREDGKVENLEARFRAKNGSIVYGLMSASVIDLEGVPHILSVTRDITQRKQSEEEKSRLESQLLQSQKMEAIGTLAGGIAHDFNNILTVISGFGALLKMNTKAGDPKEAHIDQILTASEKAAQLVQGLLAFSRNQQISLKPLDIDNTIKATSKLLTRLLTEDIELRTRLSQRNRVTMADASQIDQMLFNLASNARDAMPHGGTLSIETDVVELDDEFVNLHGYGNPGEYVLLSVSDTGAGMDEATRERIFEPFFTTKDVGKGTGLGLSTVYGIVKQHNGYINVYSEPGVGTTFRIYLPVMNEIVRSDEEMRIPAKGGNETILVAEDSSGVRKFISQILNAHGYEVIEAIDGVDAIEQFHERADTIDLLIFDSVMPKKNGQESYDEIRQINPDIRVIFTSGYTKDTFVDKGIQDEKFNFLQKPISTYALLRKVREVLDENEK